MASSRSSSRSASNPFLDKDGLINPTAFVAFAREIDKVAVKDGLKPAELYFVKTALPKFDAVKDKQGVELYVRKRHTPTGIKKRAPQTGARVRMVVLLRNYKDLDTEDYKDFHKDWALAMKAVVAHDKAALKFQETHKKNAAKKRDVVNKAFDKNIDSLLKLLDEAGVDEKNVVIGQSMMGKTVLLKLPNGGYVSIGKADEERFKKAQADIKAKAAAGSDADEKPARRGRAPKAEPVATKSTRSSSRTAKAEAPARSSRR